MIIFSGKKEGGERTTGREKENQSTQAREEKIWKS